MKTVIFIKDIIKNFDMKSEFVRKICEYLKEVKFTSITSIVVIATTIRITSTD